jgi:hypothetical protein
MEEVNLAHVRLIYTDTNVVFSQSGGPPRIRTRMRSPMNSSYYYPRLVISEQAARRSFRTLSW